MQNIRVGIINDIPMVLEGLRRVVLSMPELDVAWLARDGNEAVMKCSEDTPDLVLMDLIMPGINGVQATRIIMQKCPCPILVVTASVKANQALAFEALSAGAMDIVRTPAVIKDESGELCSIEEFKEKVLKLVRIIGYDRPSGADRQGLSHAAKNSDMLIGIGASTGGPQAIVSVLSAIPEDFSAAIVIVVHVNKEFAPGMAKWMKDMTGRPVHVVREGEPPKAGEIFLAASDDHLILSANQVLRYTPVPENNPFRPSVDVFFSSLVQHWRGEAVGVLLTGMGADGAKGLKSMRQNGWYTIAQDQKSSVIYGMPKAAAKLGAACEIMDLKLIGPRLSLLIQAFENE